MSTAVIIEPIEILEETGSKQSLEELDFFPEFEDSYLNTAEVIRGMEEVEAWPLAPILQELVRIGFVEEDEVILHSDLNFI